MAVTALGRFHGRWMQDPLLEALERDGIAPAVEGSLVRLAEDLNEALPLVADRVRELVGGRGLRLLEQLPGRTAALPRLRDEPRTLVHRDYRLDNLFFSSERGPVAIDWSGLAIGNGALDLGGFLGRCLRTAPDLDDLSALTQMYVTHRGTAGESIDDLEAKLRAAYLYWLSYAVVVLGLVPMQPGPTQVVETWIRRLLPVCRSTGALNAEMP